MDKVIEMIKRFVVERFTGKLIIEFYYGKVKKADFSKPIDLKEDENKLTGQ